VGQSHHFPEQTQKKHHMSLKFCVDKIPLYFLIRKNKSGFDQLPVLDKSGGTISSTDHPVQAVVLQSPGQFWFRCSG